MKKIVALTLACLMAASLFLTGCSVRQNGNDTQYTGNDSGNTAGDTGSNSSNSGDREVNVCSWGEYIDESLIDEFEAATGITVNYVTVESNEALYSQLQQGGVNYDVIVPSDYMISQLIEEDMLAELDYDKIPNFSLIGDQFKNLSYDPENKYTVPYTWGTLGIIYNSTMVDGEITSWDAMFDPQYAGNVLMIRNSRDAFGIALMDLGYSVNTADEAEIQEAYQLVVDANNNGVYQAFVMDEIFQLMENGNAAISAYYAGDYLTMLENNPDLRYVIPEEGTNWFVDAMCILKNAENVDEAHEWINFIASQMPTCGIWTISGMLPPTPLPWRSTPPITRNSMASLWIWSCTILWPPISLCWTSARLTWFCPAMRVRCITICGLSWGFPDPILEKETRLSRVGKPRFSHVLPICCSTRWTTKS